MSVDADRPLWVAERTDALGSEVRSLPADELREAARALAAERAEVGVSRELTARAMAFGREAVSRGTGTDVSNRAVAAAAAMTEGTVAELRSAGDMAAATALGAYWFGLAGAGAHVVTPDDRRSRELHALLAPVMELLGGNAGLVLAETDAAQRRLAYEAAVTVGSCTQLAADYLRDNLRDSAAEMVQRGLAAAVVVDACTVLVDAAPMITYLSGPPLERRPGRAVAMAMAVELRRGQDYDVAAPSAGIRFGDRAASRLLPPSAESADLAVAVDTAQEVETLLLQREGLADTDMHTIRADITTQGLLRGYRALAGVSDGRSGCADAVVASSGLGYYAPAGRGPRWARWRKAVPARVDLAFERIVDEQRSIFYRDRQEVRDRFDARLAMRSLPAAAVTAWSVRGAGEVERGLQDLLGAEAYQAADPSDAERALREALTARAAGMGYDHLDKRLHHVSLTVMDEQWAAHLGRVRFVQRHGNVLGESLEPAVVFEKLFAWCRLVTVEHILGYVLNVEP